MLPDRVSNPGPLTYESGALPIALRGPAWMVWNGWDWLQFAQIAFAGTLSGANCFLSECHFKLMY